LSCFPPPKWNFYGLQIQRKNIFCLKMIINLVLSRGSPLLRHYGMLYFTELKRQRDVMFYIYEVKIVYWSDCKVWGYKVLIFPMVQASDSMLWYPHTAQPLCPGTHSRWNTLYTAGWLLPSCTRVPSPGEETCMMFKAWEMTELLCYFRSQSKYPKETCEGK